MKRFQLLFILFFTSILACSAQKNKIHGSWIHQEEGNTIHFFINQDGTILKRKATSGETVFVSTPKSGSFKFNTNSILTIRWADKTIEKIKVKFIDNNAEFTVTEKKTKKTYLFLRIVDEEVIEQD